MVEKQNLEEREEKEILSHRLISWKVKRNKYVKANIPDISMWTVRVSGTETSVVCLV